MPGINSSRRKFGGREAEYSRTTTMMVGKR